MKDYKRDCMQTILSSVSKIKTLTEGRKYDYTIKKLELKESMTESVKAHVLSRFEEYSIDNPNWSIPKAVNAKLHIEENFELTRLKDWKTELIRSFYIWGTLKGINVAGFSLDETLVDLIDDFVYGENVEVWTFDEDIASSLYGFWGGADFDDFIFVGEQSIYILHFEVRD